MIFNKTDLSPNATFRGEIFSQNSIGTTTEKPLFQVKENNQRKTIKNWFTIVGIIVKNTPKNKSDELKPPSIFAVGWKGRQS